MEGTLVEQWYVVFPTIWNTVAVKLKFILKLSLATVAFTEEMLVYDKCTLAQFFRCLGIGH